MEAEFRKIIPFVLPLEVSGFWGLTRIMNVGSLMKNSLSIVSPQRNKAFISKSKASNTRLFYIGGPVSYQQEFDLSQDKYKSVALNVGPASLNDARSAGLASLIVGQCFGLASDTEFYNISVSPDHIKKALEVCLKELKADHIPSIIFIENAPDLSLWASCQKLVDELRSENALVVVPAGKEIYNRAISVAAIDIEDRVYENVPADIWAPGVDVAAYNPFDSRPQILTGNDVAAAFVASVALLHLEHTQNTDTVFEQLRTRKQQENNNISLLWNPFQIFEPSWDNTQDAFLGVFRWGQEIDIPLRLLNAEGREVELKFVHNDLPSTLKLNNNRLQGHLPIGKDVYCHHFVVGAGNGGSVASKMFYITITDVPEMLEPQNFHNLNIVAKGTPHYGGGDPNPPSFPPYHFIVASCLVGQTLIDVVDERQSVPIDQLKVGDKIRNSRGGSSEILQILQRTLDSRPLYSLNDGRLDLTGCHWLQTSQGTAAISTDREFDHDGKQILQLKVGDRLSLAEGGFLTVYKIVQKNGLPHDLRVYNIITDNDSGYVANGVLNVSEISTRRLFENSPKAKGHMFNYLFEKRMHDETIRK